MFCVDLRTNSDYFTVLVCITETECVYCAVRTGYLNMIPVNFILVRQCRGLLSRRPRFDPTAIYVRLVVNKVILENVYFPGTSAVPCRYHPTNAQYSLPCTLCPYHTNKQVKPEKFIKISALSETGERWR